MNVGELILSLTDLDPALVVFTEGCDCIGPAGVVRGIQEGDYGWWVDSVPIKPGDQAAVITRY